MGFSNSGAVLIFAFFHMLISLSNGSVILIGKHITGTFTDIEASFTPRIKGSGINGALYLAEPLDACSPITNVPAKGTQLPFVLIVRGECTFEDKIWNAQDAGFKAAVVYDDRDSGVLVSMAGSSKGVSIHAVFVSKASGEVLKKYAGKYDMELWIIPSYRNSAWSIMTLSVISLLTMSAILAACFFVRRHRIRREQPRTLHGREFRGMSSQLVKAMPTLIFTAVTEDNCTSATCAICLEDYSLGDKLRVLPCRHKFHASCVDSWLTAWRSFCPVCKRDASTTVGSPPASEHTPLLLCPSPGTRQPSFSSSVATSTPSPIRIQSSVSSSLATSTPTDVVNLSQTPSANLSRSASINLSRSPSINLSVSPSMNLSHSLSSSWRQIFSNDTNTLSSYRSFTNFHPIGCSRSDLRNISSSSRSHISNLTPPFAISYLSLPISSRQLHRHFPRPSNSSPSNPVESSSRPSHLRRSSDSVTTISGLASTDSLPEC